MMKSYMSLDITWVARRLLGLVVHFSCPILHRQHVVVTLLDAAASIVDSVDIQRAVTTWERCVLLPLYVRAGIPVAGNNLCFSSLLSVTFSESSMILSSTVFAGGRCAV